MNKFLLTIIINFSTSISISYCNGIQLLSTLNDYSSFASNTNNSDTNDNSNGGMTVLVNWINGMHVSF